MQWSDLPLNPSRRTLRQFAILWILFFGGLAAWRWFALDQRTLAVTLAVLGATIGSLGLIAPSVVRPIFVGWTVMAFPLGWVVSRVVLLLIFGLVITPLGIIFRLRGRDVLQLRRSSRQTHWSPKPTVSDSSSYFRQF